MTKLIGEPDLNRRRLWVMGATAAGAAAVSSCATQAAAATGAGAPASDMAERLEALEARNKITDVLLAYARANDRKDEDLLRSCFWPESTHRHGRFDGTSTDFIGFAFGIISSLHYAAHHISNISVEVDGDRGFSECYYFAHHRRPAAEEAGEQDAFFEGRYIDIHERRDGVWKIIQRRGVSDYSIVVPAGDSFADWNPEHRSLNAPDDPYYALRKAFRAGG